MKTLKTLILLIISFLVISCKKQDANSITTIVPETSNNNIFTCKIDGKDFIVSIQEFNTNMVRTIVSKQYVVSGDNSNFSVGLNIPYDAQTGVEIHNFETIIDDHKAGYTYLSEKLENPKLIIKSKRKGFISGTFSFTTSKGVGTKKIVVTDGKFETDLLYDD